MQEGVATSTLGPGQGGVSRGRGDAPMIWGEESPGRTDQFEAKALPKAERLDLEHSAVFGLASAPPAERARGEAGGQSPPDRALARSAWRRRLAPHHREAVKSFFKPAKR